MDPIPPEALAALAAHLGRPGAQWQVDGLPGDHFNRADRISLLGQESKEQFLIKRYRDFGGDRSRKARVH